ncbi:hypothetical protein BS78_02G083100 [Paspalum vaginatum]|nr:hypothetical protein BS78_02G083100 [Paspalum vaginatum]
MKPAAFYRPRWGTNRWRGCRCDVRWGRRRRRGGPMVIGGGGARRGEGGQGVARRWDEMGLPRRRGARYHGVVRVGTERGQEGDRGETVRWGQGDRGRERRDEPGEAWPRRERGRTAASPTHGVPAPAPRAAADASGTPLPSTSSVAAAMDAERWRRRARRETVGARPAEATAVRRRKWRSRERSKSEQCASPPSHRAAGRGLRATTTTTGSERGRRWTPPPGFRRSRC